MRPALILSGVALCFGATCFGADKEKQHRKSNVRPTVVAEVPAATKPTAAASTSSPVARQRSEDEAAIRKTDEAFVNAYSQGNAKTVAAHFTEDAEYVDELGNVFQGRQAIEDSLTRFFAENPGCKLKMQIDTMRFIDSSVAVQDGTATITRSDAPATLVSHYTKVHVKTDGKWLAASVRDHAPKDRRQHRAQLQQLEWLVGDWVEEGDESIVHFSCHPTDNGNFLLRKFTIQIAGQQTMSGTQRIGWDPVTGKLRAWIFDSEGGYSEGHWSRNGDNWVLKSTGVTADGQTASSTSNYASVNAHTMTWQSVHHEIAGVHLPDSEIVTIVRQAPAPLIADDRK